MNLFDSFRKYRTYRQTVSELSRLSNRGLADAGLTRGTIREVAKRSV